MMTSSGHIHQSVFQTFFHPGSLNQGFCLQIKRKKCQKDMSIWNHAHSGNKLIVSKLAADTLVHRQIVLTHFIKAVQTLKNFSL